MHVRSEQSDRKIKPSYLLRIGLIPTINKLFSVHARELERRGHLGLDRVTYIIVWKSRRRDARLLVLARILYNILTNESSHSNNCIE